MSIIYDGEGSGSTTTDVAGAAATSSTGVWDVAAVGTQGAWVDLKGGVFNVQSDIINGLPASTTGYTDTFLARPAAEDAVNQAIFAFFAAGADTTVQTGLLLRLNRSNGAHYLADLGRTGSANLTIYRIDSGGGVTNLASVGHTWNPAVPYLLSFQASGASPTSLRFRVYQNGSTTPDYEVTATDSTSGHQAAHSAGLSVWKTGLWGGGHAEFLRVTVADDDTPLPPSFVPPPPPATVTYAPSGEADALVALDALLDVTATGEADVLWSIAAPAFYTATVLLDAWSTESIPTTPPPDFSYTATGEAFVLYVGDSPEVSFYLAYAEADATYDVDGLFRFTATAEAAARFRRLSDGRVDLLAQDVYPR